MVRGRRIRTIARGRVPARSTADHRRKRAERTLAHQQRSPSRRRGQTRGPSRATTQPSPPGPARPARKVEPRLVAPPAVIRLKARGSSDPLASMLSSSRIRRGGRARLMPTTTPQPRMMGGRSRQPGTRSTDHGPPATSTIPAKAMASLRAYRAADADLCPGPLRSTGEGLRGRRGRDRVASVEPHAGDALPNGRLQLAHLIGRHIARSQLWRRRLQVGGYSGRRLGVGCDQHQTVRVGPQLEIRVHRRQLAVERQRSLVQLREQVVVGMLDRAGVAAGRAGTDFRLFKEHYRRPRLGQVCGGRGADDPAPDDRHVVHDLENLSHGPPFVDSCSRRRRRRNGWNCSTGSTRSSMSATC